MLRDEQRQRVVEMARARGIDEAEALRVAERIESGKVPSQSADSVQPDEAGHPVADRMLIGFLPFVTVKELRTIWLKLDEPLPDWEMPTGEWLNIHGQSAAAAATGGDPNA